MTQLLDRIRELLDSPQGELGEIERTLTDGYAQVLTLEAERRRLERRLAEVAEHFDAGDTTEKTREISSLARRLGGNGGDLTKLRGLLADLRRHAEQVRSATAT